MPTESWDKYLLGELRNPTNAAAFLSDAFEEGTPEEIEHAIGRVLEANGARNGHNISQELIALRKLGLHVNITTSRVV